MTKNEFKSTKAITRTLRTKNIPFEYKFDGTIEEILTSIPAGEDTDIPLVFTNEKNNAVAAYIFELFHVEDDQRYRALELINLINDEIHECKFVLDKEEFINIETYFPVTVSNKTKAKISLELYVTFYFKIRDINNIIESFFKASDSPA